VQLQLRIADAIKARDIFDPDELRKVVSLNDIQRRSQIEAGFATRSADALENRSTGERPKSIGRRPDRAETPAPAGSPAGDRTSLVRYPSVAAEGALRPAEEVTLVIDLALEPAQDTAPGEAVIVADLPPLWSEIAVEVRVFCPQIRFEEGAGEGVVLVRRGRSSQPARLTGRLVEDLGDLSAIEVVGFFSFRGRTCGLFRRLFKIEAASGDGAADREAIGHALLDPSAEPPAMTVHIFRFQSAPDGWRHWHVRTHPKSVPGLPPSLTGETLLQAGAAEFVRQVLGAGAVQNPDGHLHFLEGVGQTLWDAAPACFRDAYQAVRRHCGPGFPIQFISDDPHIPWELMRPSPDQSSEDEGEASLLLLDHPVGRWLVSQEGILENRLPSGEIITAAPNYERAGSSGLPFAQLETQALISRYNARPVRGRRADLLKVLIDTPSAGPVSVIHFAGHGAFDPEAPDTSMLALEDGVLMAPDFANRAVRLGANHGTLVILNACQVGATGLSLVGLGGFAEAILSRRFRGFLGPLWFVDDAVSGAVLTKFLAGLIDEGLIAGEAIRRARTAYVQGSSTPLAYIYFGDVMARIQP
jgi:hypothetical protein